MFDFSKHLSVPGVIEEETFHYMDYNIEPGKIPDEDDKIRKTGVRIMYFNGTMSDGVLEAIDARVKRYRNAGVRVMVHIETADYDHNICDD